MKIIYLHQYFNIPTMVGGTRSYEMARRLVKSGHEVHMITSWREEDSSKDDWFNTEEEGIYIHWLPIPYSNKMSYNQRIHAFFKYALQAGVKAKEIGGDIVFATSTPLTIAIPAVTTAKKLGIPMVFEVRDLWPELPIAIGAINNPILKYLAKRLELYAYKHAQHIIALSPGMAKGVLKTNYPENDITVIPNSADLDEFNPRTEEINNFRSNYPELGDSPIVLYAGTLGAINGVDYLAKVASKVININKDIKFVVFGEGADWNKVMKNAEKLNVLNENFFMYSSLPKKELPLVFGMANLSTSLFIDLKEMEANSANKFFDALASGTPTLINYGGWQASLLTDNNAGLQLSRDIGNAALTIVELLEQPCKIKNMGKNARTLAEKEFSRDILASQLEEVFSKVHLTRNNK